jgi:hypothetical protein
MKLANIINQVGDVKYKHHSWMSFDIVFTIMSEQPNNTRSQRWHSTSQIFSDTQKYFPVPIYSPFH